MEVTELKERIINEGKIVDILEALGMHSIVEENKHFACGMPDGDRKNSTIVYKNSLNVDAYTRNIKDAYGVSDIISLTSYIRESYFTDSVHWLCQICSFDYYGSTIKKSKLAEWTREMHQVKTNENDITDEKLKPISETLLDYYGEYVTDFFAEDGISYQTQAEFELGYDTETNMITIPIRDELGNLVGVKGRLFKEKVLEHENKYLYLHPCSKTRILYGLDKTWKYIKEMNEVIVVEAEKSVQQLWDMGFKNAVAIGGHKLSKYQVKKLTHLNVPITIAYDEGVEIGRDGLVDKTFYKDEFDKFIDSQEVYIIYDRYKECLEEKESPSDNPDKWSFLYKNKIKVRG